ncbi:DUF1573 domain-containing protein [Lacipirellula parvula]|uniref:DUF1573 domain-containing protein n=1 Tax=Lacipirellula parvula TaxID=2650471 RepID=A0A5K7XPZ7_9BACT|nr:DUF1573 domain-containing protein [Lacipirellula parvula]BBO35569.1 hypothetical protein PLANPX_5181 [Lacipirellula parvula]
MKKYGATVGINRNIRCHLSFHLMVAIVTIACATGCTPSQQESLSAAKQLQTASLVCTEATWNLGEVLVKGKALDFTHVFHVENRSTKSIKLADVRSDCGCVVADDYESEIPPGHFTDISVTISVFGPPGGFRKTIMVIDDDTSQPPCALSIVGSRAVSDLLYCYPAKINFGRICRGDSKTKEILISRYDGSAVNFRTFVSDECRLKIDGKPTSLTRSDEILRRNCELIQVPLKLELDTEPVGLFKSKARILTESTDEGTAELEIELEATIIDKATPWVPSIFVGRLPADEIIERSLVAIDDLEQIPRIISASYSGDASMHTEVIDSNDLDSTKAPRVRITRIGVGSGNRLARGRLTIETSRSPDATPAVVEISAFLSP